MFPMQTQSTGNISDYMRVSIREVNMVQNYIQAIDTFGRSYQITFSLLDPLVAIPVPGELWLLRRRGTDWLLDSRLETGLEKTPISSLLPGDRRLEASKNLYLNGSKILINGREIQTAPYLNLQDFKTSTMTDDAIAMQLALDQLGTNGGTIVIPTGTWTWKSIPKIAPSIIGSLLITGEAGAIIKLTQVGSRAFDFNRTREHQTFQNIEISDLTIDANGITGRGHIVLGSFPYGTTLSHMNFDNIKIQRVKTINVSNGNGSVIATEFANVYLIAAQDAANEPIRNTITRISIEDCIFNGGAHGVIIGGFNTQGNGSVGSIGTNTFCDEIYLRNVTHDTGWVPTSTYFPSANFSLGAVGQYGSCVIRDCHGKNAGDPGIEADGWDYFLADNVVIEDAGVSGFLWTNFDNPRSSNQQYVWRNCHYRRTKGVTGIGWLIQSSAANISLGHATLRDCSFLQDRVTEVPGEAIRTNTVQATSLKSLTVDGFKADHQSFVYSGGGLQQWPLFNLTNLAGTTSIIINKVMVTISGSRTGAGAIVNSILWVGGGTINLNMQNITVASNIVGQGSDNHWTFLLGAGYTTTLTGSARGIKPTSITADTNPRMFYVFDTSTLTIPTDFRLSDIDLTNWPTNIITHYQTGTQNSDKIFIEGANGYQTISLAGSWVAFGSGTHTPVYKKTLAGLVSLGGMAASGSVNSVLTTLPAGFRPASTLFFVIIADTGGGTRVQATVTIEPNGNVTVYDNGTGGGNYISLSGIEFYAGE